MDSFINLHNDKRFIYITLVYIEIHVGSFFGSFGFQLSIITTIFQQAPLTGDRYRMYYTVHSPCFSIQNHDDAWNFLGSIKLIVTCFKFL